MSKKSKQESSAIKLTDLDRRILWAMDFDARVSLTELAVSLKTTKQVLSYRIARMTKEGLITGRAAILDRTRLGYLTYRVYFRYKAFDYERERKVLQYFQEHFRVLWIVSLAGAWDLEVLFSEKNSYRFNEILKQIRSDLGDYFARHNVSVSTVNYYYRRDYLLKNNNTRSGKEVAYYGLDPKSGDWDDLDRKILIKVSHDCNRSNEQLARDLGISAHTVKNRLESLEKREIIQAYRTFLDISKLGRRYFKAILMLAGLTKVEEQKLYNLCGEEASIVCLTEVLGDWQLEIEGEMREQQELVELMRILKSEFPTKILDYDIVEVTGVHKYNFFPDMKLLAEK